jgi:hypothetical protein
MTLEMWVCKQSLFDGRFRHHSRRVFVFKVHTNIVDKAWQIVRKKYRTSNLHNTLDSRHSWIRTP